ncbi:MAG: DUF3810 domain-containing protein [Ruminococcaceae bacterium]|nr:DUF3810 domain-containing protein [Oscillospiraceae bacterium]
MIFKKAAEKIKSFYKSCVPKWTVYFYAAGAISLILYIIMMNSTAFSDFFNENIAAYFRAFTATVSGIVGISLAELIIYMLVPTLVLFFIGVIKDIKQDRDNEAVRKYVSAFAIISMFATTFVFSLASGYRGSSLDVRLGLSKNTVSKEELYEVAMYLGEEVSKCSEEVEYIYGSHSVMPYSFSELTDKINEAYKSVCDDYDFILDFKSSVKPVVASEVLSYAHILGIYTYYTGESNVNVNFPDYTLPFTCAHEMSHQRGFSREDEANFMAYLVCIASEDAYIRYSGYYNMYEYVMNALYSADKEGYSEVYYSTRGQVRWESSAYRKFYEKYRENTVADVSNKVNDGYLQSQGQSQGVKSYGLVVDLMVAYYNLENK